MGWGCLSLAITLSVSLCMSFRELGSGGDTEPGSGESFIDEIDLLDKLTSLSSDLTNVSISAGEDNCTVYEIGQYSTLTAPTRDVFGISFADEFTLLIKLRYTMREDTVLFTVLSSESHVLLQVRINPYAFVFVTTRRRYYEFPISFLSDGRWHKVAVSVSWNKIELYADCKFIESVRWKNYFGMEVTTEGLVIVGGLIEAFETPFEGLIQQLLFVMGKPTAAKEHCTRYHPTCKVTSKDEPVLSGPDFREGNYFLSVRSEGSGDITHEIDTRPALTQIKGITGHIHVKNVVRHSVSGKPPEYNQNGGTELLNHTNSAVTNSRPGRPGTNINIPSLPHNYKEISNTFHQTPDFKLNEILEESDDRSNVKTRGAFDEVIGKELYLSVSENQGGVALHKQKQDGVLVVSDNRSVTSTSTIDTQLITNSSSTYPDGDVPLPWKEIDAQQEESMLIIDLANKNAATSKKLRWYEADIDLNSDHYLVQNTKEKVISSKEMLEMESTEETALWQHKKLHRTSEKSSSQAGIQTHCRVRTCGRARAPGPRGPGGLPGPPMSLGVWGIRNVHMNVSDHHESMVCHLINSSNDPLIHSSLLSTHDPVFTWSSCSLLSWRPMCCTNCLQPQLTSPRKPMETAVALDLTRLPQECHGLATAFSRMEASTLPPRRPHDCNRPPPGQHPT
ncbi:uncharacterized protein LOC134359716 [Mobula hypostoma]|uniref:uncharacterized protein LOC134359716 n=1 Tax=Mobula hypostoma TaxID=723540 RepID=UPI002FC28C10